MFKKKVSERSLDSFLYFIFSQGPVSSYYFYRLVPNLKTITSFCSLAQIQRNQRPLLRDDLLYPVKQLKHVFESLKI